MSESESIVVAVRIRPFVQSQIPRATKNETEIEWEPYGSNSVVNTRTKQSYNFDYVFGENTSTQAVYELVAQPLVKVIFQGLNASIFAYGQTCSGKTYTMRGNALHPGIIILAVREIFNLIRSQENCDFMVRVCFLEVYNETINDLLKPSNTNLDIREGAGREVYIEGLTEYSVRSEDEALHWLYYGDHLRKTGSTQMNQESSRSHSIFRVTLEIQSDERTTISHLSLIDLAGSEGVQKTGTEGLLLREGSNINRSLLYLSTVIQKLSEASRSSKKDFINYRDSKLTRILQSSLNGNSRTAIVCNITPTNTQYTETLNTILFGTRAKNIKTQAKVNEVHTSESLLLKTNAEIKSLQQHKKLYLQKIERAESELSVMGLTLKQKDDYIAEITQNYTQEIVDYKRKLIEYEQLIKQLDSRVLRSAEKSSSMGVGHSPEFLKSVIKAHNFGDFGDSGVLASRVLQLEQTLETERLEFQEMKKSYENLYQEKVLEMETLGTAKIDQVSNSAVSSMNSKIALCMKELQEAKDRTAELEFMLEETSCAKQTVESLQYRAAIDSARIQQLQQENQELREICLTLESDKALLASKAQDAEAEAAKFKQEIAYLQQEQKSPPPSFIQSRVSASSPTTIVSRGSEASALSQTNYMSPNIKELENDFRLTHLDNSDALLELQKLKNHLNSAVKSRDDIRIELFNVSRQLETSKQRENELQESIKLLQEYHRKNRNANTKAESELIEMSSELQDLQNALMECEKCKQALIDEKRLGVSENLHLYRMNEQLETTLAYYKKENEDLRRSYDLLLEEVCHLTQKNEVLESTENPQSEIWRLKYELMNMQELNNNLIQRNADIVATLKINEAAIKEQQEECALHLREKLQLEQEYGRCRDELEKLHLEPKQSLADEEYDRLQRKCFKLLKQSTEYMEARDRALSNLGSKVNELHACKKQMIDLEESIIRYARETTQRSNEREVVEADENARRML